jgi:hypothetical protein
MSEMLFVGFVGGMTALIVTTVTRYLGGRAAWWLLTGLLVWLTYSGLLGYAGVLKNMTMRPPGVVFLVVPVLIFLLAFLAFVLLSSASARLALAIPLWILLGAQSFRVGVELFLHQLCIDGMVPKMLTFGGANVDIYVGASAVLIAWLSARGRLGLRLALAWNVLGLLSLANVVTRAVLTAPGPLHLIHSEVPNLLLGTFPFLFIPALFVPLGVVLHLLALRSIVSRLRSPSASLQT